MHNGESDFVSGLKDYPTQGGRPLCERCWNGKHCKGQCNGCKCPCSDNYTAAKRRKLEPQALLSLDDAPPIEVK